MSFYAAQQRPLYYSLFLYSLLQFIIWEWFLYEITKCSCSHKLTPAQLHAYEANSLSKDFVE